MVVFGDDGEKFGTWPETKKHVYEDGWLVRFFDALVANQDWLQVTTPAEAVDNVPPVGKVYLPDCSYREMTEWALPTEQLVEYERIAHEMQDDPRWPALRRFVARRLLAELQGEVPRGRRDVRPHDDGQPPRAGERRRKGAVGRRWSSRPAPSCTAASATAAIGTGRSAASTCRTSATPSTSSLIAADNVLDRAAGRPETWIEAAADDYNFDGRQEIRLANDRLMALVLPSRGGQMAELDVRRIQHNLLATLTRQPEAYHRKVLAGANSGNGHCASIHDRVVFKQADLDQRIQYDDYPRKSLLDLFYDNDATLEAVASGQAAVRAISSTPSTRPASAAIPTASRCSWSARATACGVPVRITKGLTLDAGSSTLRDRLPAGEPAARTGRSTSPWS